MSAAPTVIVNLTDLGKCIFETGFFAKVHMIVFPSMFCRQFQLQRISPEN